MTGSPLRVYPLKAAYLLPAFHIPNDRDSLERMCWPTGSHGVLAAVRICRLLGDHETKV
jgi:hypothetical protein